MPSVVFNGKKYKLSGNYYRRNVWGSKGTSNLHRAIWEAHKGPIPDGHEIHHVDGNTFNNAIDNLECVDAKQHQREHAIARYADGTLKPPGVLARLNAAKWHASEEGIKWHQEHGVKTWENRKMHAKNCVQCGQQYETPYPNKSKFCHANCRAKNLRAKQKITNA